MEAGANTGNSLSKGRLDPRLSQLARLYGIQTFYVDARKQRVDAHPESILQVLQVLGAPLRNPEDAGKVLQQERRRREDQVEPVFVAWDGQFRELKLPKGSKAVLELASGGNVAWPPRAALPNGYHRLHVTHSGKTTSSLVISSPLRAWFPTDTPEWGVFAPLYALHSKRSPHAGDLTDLRTLAQWTHNQAGRVVSTLPLLAAFLDRPFEPSPYSPVSRLFWNELYIDPARVPEFASLTQGSLQSLQTRRKPSRLVDYRVAMQEKRKVLEALAREFFLNGTEERRTAFRKFVESDPQVTAYAQFRSRTESAGKGWHQWSSGLPQGDRQSEGLHLYVQWIVQDQLQELSTSLSAAGDSLYLDLPLGLHWDGFDTWRFPGLFATGVTGGAPPDPVFTAGQNWAFQPLHPRAIRADGYRYLIAVLRNHLRYAKLLRIDHVMGLHRLFWIPEGSSGDRGVYVEYPAEEMYAILCLESHRAQAGIVGENLGVVSPEVNRSMNRHNIRQLYVAQYETVLEPKAGGHRTPLQSNKPPLRRPPRGSVASLNTHDLFPFQAFLDGSDIETRLKLKLLKPKDATIERKQRARVRRMLFRFAGKDPLQGCLNFLGESPASIVLVNLEDLWNETAAQNVPSTTTEHPNWRRRLRYSTERLLKNAHVTDREPVSVRRRKSRTKGNRS